MLNRLVVGAALIAAGFGAQAMPVTETLNFTLGGFVDAFSNAPPPIATISGSITVTFDPAVTYENDINDIIVNYLNGGFVSGSALGFSYGSSTHRLRFGGIQNNAETVFGGTNDLLVGFDMTDLANPTLFSCATPGYSCGKFTGNSAWTVSAYAQANSPASIWEASSAQSSVTVGAAVPEPETWALMLVGTTLLAARKRTISPRRG